MRFLSSVVFVAGLTGCRSACYPPCQGPSSPDPRRASTFATGHSIAPGSGADNQGYALRYKCAIIPNIDLSTIPENLSESEWVDHLKALDGMEVCALGCALSMNEHESIRSIVLVPCRFDVVPGSVLLHAPNFPQEIVVELGAQRLTTLPSTPIRVVGTLHLGKITEGTETWAWGKIERASVEAIVTGR
jgi:hypothetical protein